MSSRPVNRELAVASASNVATTCRGQALSPLERYMLADDRPQYPRTFVIGFDFAGEIDSYLFERVLSESLSNEPRLTASVGRCGLFGYQWECGGHSAVDLRWFDGREALDRAECLRLDLRCGQGLRIIAEKSPGRTQIYHVFHHACCDGRGALAWLGRLYAAYSRATCPDVPIQAGDVDVSALHKVTLTEDLPERMGSRVLARQATWRRIREELTTRPVRLRPAQCADRAPGEAERIRFPGSLTHALDNSQTRRLKRGAQRTCATLNDLLLCAMFRCLYDWNHAQGAAADKQWFRIMAPVDLRTPQHDRLPAANLVSCVFVTQPGVVCSDPQRLLSAVTRRMQYAVSSRSALIMYHVIRRLAQVPGLLDLALRAWVQATALVSYVGDAGREMQAPPPAGTLPDRQSPADRYYGHRTGAIGNGRQSHRRPVCGAACAEPDP
jgi:hypothetical protein